MKKYVVAIVVGLFAGPALAQSPVPQKTYTLSSLLVEEILGRLAKEPYGDVSNLIANVQNEAQHQPPPVTCPPPEAQAK